MRSKGEDGTPLEQYPEQMWRRVARGIAAVERDAPRSAPSGKTSSTIC